MFGAVAGASHTQDAALSRACRAAIEDDVPLLIEGAFAADVIDLTGVASGGVLDIRHEGMVKHVDSASDHLFQVGSRDILRVTGNGTFDGNMDEQPAYPFLFRPLSVRRIEFDGLRFINMAGGGIRKTGDSDGSTSLILKNMRFFRGKDHSGTPGEFCEFVHIRHTGFTHVKNVWMWHDQDPVDAEHQCNPAGLAFRHTEQAYENVSSRALIEDCRFENLGFAHAGNLVGMVDFYSRMDSVHLLRNRFRRPRFCAFRTSFARHVRIEVNEFYQNAPVYGLNGIESAGSVFVSMTKRPENYPNEQGDNDLAEFLSNTVLYDGQMITCGFRAFNTDENTGVFKQVVSRGNRYRHINKTNVSSGGPAFQTVGVLHTVSEDDVFEGFSTAMRVDGTTVRTATAARRASATCRGASIRDANSGFFATTNIGNLDVTIDDMQHETAPAAFSYIVRDAGDVTVTASKLAGHSGDARNNDSFHCHDNAPGTATLPAGYTSNDYYDIHNNELMPDVRTPLVTQLVTGVTVSAATGYHVVTLTVPMSAAIRGAYGAAYSVAIPENITIDARAETITSVKVIFRLQGGADQVLPDGIVSVWRTA